MYLHHFSPHNRRHVSPVSQSLRVGEITKENMKYLGNHISLTALKQRTEILSLIKNTTEVLNRLLKDFKKKDSLLSFFSKKKVHPNEFIIKYHSFELALKEIVKRLQQFYTLYQKEAKLQEAWTSLETLWTTNLPILLPLKGNFKHRP
ncbi:MAG: hypothetical protein HEQ32_06170 [Vampirovibrio sp.]